MSTNCIRCVVRPRTGGDLKCDACRAADQEWDRLTAENAKLRAEVERLKEMNNAWHTRSEAQRTAKEGAEARIATLEGLLADPSKAPWPPLDATMMLIHAADLLLDRCSYDGDGHEAIRKASRVAAAWCANRKALEESR